MKKLISILLTVVMLFGLCSAALAEAPIFTWGMMKDEVIELMGEKGIEDNQSTAGSELLRYFDQKISDFDALLVFIFRNDALYGRLYNIDDSNRGKYKYLTEALTIKYGDTVDKVAAVSECFSIMNVSADEEMLVQAKELDMLAFESWQPSEDMNIVIFNMKSGDKEFTCLFYIQPLDQIGEKQYNFDGL